MSVSHATARLADRPPRLLVGRSSRGEWLVRDVSRNRDERFNSRADALGFAFRIRGDAAGAVVLVPGILELFEAPPIVCARPDAGEIGARETLLEI
jgi:hypothetical protein